MKLSELIKMLVETLANRGDYPVFTRNRSGNLNSDLSIYNQLPASRKKKDNYYHLDSEDDYETL